jgi:hypothetical protein
MNTNETIKRLFNKLQEEIAQLEKEEKEKLQQSVASSSTTTNVPTLGMSTLGVTSPRTSNPFEIIAQPVIERAKLLLRMVPSMRRVRYPSAVSANPFAIHRDRSLSGETLSHPTKETGDRFARFRQSYSLLGTKDQTEQESFV